MKTFINNKGEVVDRQQVQCYTRVMGYLRPVDCFNVGKKSEFYSRIYFDKLKANNKKFKNTYR